MVGAGLSRKRWRLRSTSSCTAIAPDSLGWQRSHLPVAFSSRSTCASWATAIEAPRPAITKTRAALRMSHVFSSCHSTRRPAPDCSAARSCRTRAVAVRRSGTACSSPCQGRSGSNCFLFRPAAWGRSRRRRNRRRSAAIPACVVETGKLLIGLKHKTPLVVAQREGPELLGGHVRRQMHLVGLAAIERVARGVDVSNRVLRALAHHSGDHRWCDPRRVEVDKAAGVQHASAIFEKFMAATGDGVLHTPSPG